MDPLGRCACCEVEPGRLWVRRSQENRLCCQNCEVRGLWLVELRRVVLMSRVERVGGTVASHLVAVVHKKRER